MNATDYVSGWKVSAAEAAVVIADEWCRQKTESIDLWGCDWFGQEFIEKFLERCLQNKCIFATAKIKWQFPGQLLFVGEPTYYDLTRKWTESWFAGHFVTDYDWRYEGF